MKLKILSFVLLLIIVSCNSGFDHIEYIKRGNKISNSAQTELLAKVGKAIQYGGTKYAVEFCNLESSGIVDSLKREYNCSISRISKKNRNLKAGLKTTQEKELWSIFENGTISDTIIIQGENTITYYKSIHIGLPACLKCHGKPGSDINVETAQKINELYPKDLATNYQLEDFRGLWKIEFERK